MFTESPLQSWQARIAVYPKLCPVSLTLVSTPASQAFVERIFYVYGQLSSGLRNQMTISPERSHQKTLFGWKETHTLAYARTHAQAGWLDLWRSIVLFMFLLLLQLFLLTLFEGVSQWYRFNITKTLHVNCAITSFIVFSSFCQMKVKVLDSSYNNY